MIISATSSASMACVFSSPGRNPSPLKKGVRTKPGFIRETRILLALTSSLNACENPLRPNLAVEYRVALRLPVSPASEPKK